ncbi:hypothetical protein OKA04_17660 [Luteolibacter flavescens]|uniref:Uncharacterized protein n=1 Tax=Luteolibacter flavescens TaxID=1859460 RepID=A0ABT3FSL1_9BACT|nr:hypothetical protein [Luteolibacter flavescens]MCW1886569.1 hypothetical protein [Luteolibacter flavescens]
MKLLSPALLAATCAAATAGYAVLFHDGEAAQYRLWYYTPAAALGGAFIAERLAMPGGKRAFGVDLVVALLCLARPLTGQPPVSGHAWFAVHALLTLEGKFSRAIAGAVLALTLYAKLVLWNGDVTLWPGLAAGIVSGLLWRKWQRKNE